jgi:hypothetical protein
MTGQGVNVTASRAGLAADRRQRGTSRGWMPVDLPAPCPTSPATEPGSAASFPLPPEKPLLPEPLLLPLGLASR